MTLAILLLGLGLALILAEVMIPSFGMLGLLAALSILGANVVAFQNDAGVGFLIVTGVLVPVVILGGLKVLPHSPLGRLLISEGYSSEDSRAVDRRDATLLGAVGVVEAPLRPAGVARIDRRRVDVVSRGDLIEAGARVRVVELKGNRVVVARMDESSAVGADASAAQEER